MKKIENLIQKKNELKGQLSVCECDKVKSLITLELLMIEIDITDCL